MLSQSPDPNVPVVVPNKRLPLVKIGEPDEPPDTYPGLSIGRLYGQRWGIETLFGAYKSRGFHLESCRVVAHDRLRCLLFVLSLGLVWAIQTGQWLIEQGQAIPQRVVKAANQTETTAGVTKRKVYSLFRHGLDELRDRVLGNRPLSPLIPLLSCP